MAPTTIPPKPVKEHWLFGSVKYFLNDPMNYLREQNASHKGVYRLTMPGRKIVVLSRPEYVKYVLQENNRNYTKSMAYNMLSKLLGKGLLTSEGDFWRKQRRLAQPAFHRERLAMLMDTMVECINDLIVQLEKHPEGEPINLAKEMMGVTLHVVARSMFSSDVKDVVKAVGKEFDIINESAVRRIKNPLKLPLWVPIPENIEEQRALGVLNDIVLKIIADRRSSTERYDDLLQMLMDVKDEDTGEQMSDQQLRDECMTIFLAGHETTALTMSWLWYLLDQYPGKAQKLEDEIDTVLGGKTPTLSDLRRLEYTRKVIDESLRMYPPAWIIGRRTIEDDNIGGYNIVAGTNVILPIYAIHHDPDIWNDPDSFIPERFNKENMQEKHRYAYFPFGGGPRLCIGNNFALMEMQLLVSMLLQRFRFNIDPKFDPKPDALLTLRPKNGTMTARVVRKS